MAFIFITLGLIVLYFIISFLKEGETKQAVELERKKSFKREANVHFNNMLENEIVRQNNMKRSRELFVTQLENYQGVKKASIEENTLTIITDYQISMFEADDFARMWINNLITETEINIVKVYDCDGFISAVAEREIQEKVSKVKNQKTQKSQEIENLVTKQQNNLEFMPVYEMTKYKINSMFYEFCFTKENINFILENGNQRAHIIKALILQDKNEEKLLVKLFKKFLKFKHGFSLSENDTKHYNLNEFEFYIDEKRINLNESYQNFFEILYNDFENIQDKDGLNMPIAKEFIIYCSNFSPIAVFVLIYDSNFNKYFIRRVFENGVSSKINQFVSIDDDEHIEYLKQYVNVNI